ncbi:MAG: APC family permease [Eubacteriaceae bacterium]|nr:APC family permease [Eubacteriaceae bacterium]
MDNKLDKKYGFFTAYAMVVGTVIGSGVFFKAEKVLTSTGGDLPLGIAAWIIGGAIMLVCAYAFSQMASRFAYINGVVDYAEAVIGKTYGYYLAWFLATIYYPTLTSVLAWVSARYTCVLFGFPIAGGECLVITAFYLIGSYALNSLSPVLAGKFQTTTTIIKLIPLFLMAIIGTFKGLSSGLMIENFTTITTEVETGPALFSAVCATAFAYDGWIIATSMNSELKDAKKTLPKALVLGSISVVVIYILYYIGLSGTVSNAELMASGEAGAKIAFSSIFGKMGGTFMFVFVVISCLGTLNGLMLGCTRGMYTIAVRNRGPAVETFREVDSRTNMPTNSGIFALLVTMAWVLYFYGANLAETSWFGFFTFDSSEIPIITSYPAYIPIFIMFMVKSKDLGFVKRFVMPLLAVIGCAFMCFAAVLAHGKTVVAYLIVFVVIMSIGAVYSGEKEPPKDEVRHHKKRKK